MVGLLISPSNISLTNSFISLLAVAIGSGAAGALNMWYESDLDAIMSRTCLRPIPSGKIKKKSSALFWYYLIDRVYFIALRFFKFIIIYLVIINYMFLFFYLHNLVKKERHHKIL